MLTLGGSKVWSFSPVTAAPPPYAAGPKLATGYLVRWSQSREPVKSAQVAQDTAQMAHNDSTNLGATPTVNTSR